MKRTVLLTTILLALAGCNQQQASAPSTATHAAPPAAPIPPQPPKPTPEAWRAAFDSSFHIIGKTEDAGDGVFKFTACFDPVAPTDMKNCNVGAFAEKDGFRKLWIFTPRYSSVFSNIFVMGGDSYVSSYVSVRENKAPKILLSPHYAGSEWLFVTSFAVMVDGDVVLEQTFSQPGDVKTHVGSGYVEESSDFVLSDQQVAALRKIQPGSKVIIRITGKNGYVSIDSSKSKKLFNSALFTSDIKETLAIHDAIDANTHGKKIVGP